MVPKCIRNLTLTVIVGGLGCAQGLPQLDAEVGQEGLHESWLASVQKGLADREYEASLNATGLQAPNRRHNLRTYFEPDGIRVVDREDPASPELLGLRFAAWGRGDASVRAESGEVHHEGARVEIRREGLVEWFVNSPEGLEHGFTIEARLPGEGELVFDLATERATASLIKGLESWRLYPAIQLWLQEPRRIQAAARRPAPHPMPPLIAMIWPDT